MNFWPELVELFEYKVADALQGRVPRGGKRSLGELREELLGAPLEPALHRRVIEVDRQYRAQLKAGRTTSAQGELALRPGAPSSAPIQPQPWVAPATGDTAEVRAWEELRLMAWHDQVKAHLRELAAQWQLETSLISLRVLFTVTENAERAARIGADLLPVPTASDPLVSLHDPEVRDNVLVTFAELLLTPEGRERVVSALSKVHEEPFPRHRDDDVLEARLAALDREKITTEEREALIRALKDRHPQSRDPRERPAIRDAVRNLARRLEPLLKSAPAEHMRTVPSHSVLYSLHPGSALRTPDEGSDELVIHLRGGQAARWRGLDFRWQFISPNWQLQAGGQVVLLRPQQRLTERAVTLKFPDVQVRVFTSGGHAMLRAEVQLADEMARRAALGQAVALLLDPSAAYGALRLARATAQLLRDGTVKAEGLTPESAHKYQDASAEALLDFARKGAQTLAVRLQRLTPEEAQRTIHQAAATLGLGEELSARLAQATQLMNSQPEPLPAPVTTTRIEVPLDERFISVQLTSEPLTLQVGQRALTLRHDFKGELAAVLPGHPALILHDLLVIRLPDLHVLLVRHGHWLAVAAGQGTGHSPTTTAPLPHPQASPPAASPNDSAAAADQPGKQVKD